MGLFRVPARLTGPTGQSEETELFVDTGTLCFIAPAGPALLGAVALEGLFLAVDPVRKRLVPTEGIA